MSDTPLPDPSTPFGERVQRRLRDDRVLWFTSVGRDGTPQPNPVWFLWGEDSFLVYNRSNAARVTHVRTRPQVALHFNSSGHGGDVVVVTGRAERADGEPAPHEHAAYVAKYGDDMVQVAGSQERFSQLYPVPLRVRPLQVRGF